MIFDESRRFSFETPTKFNFEMSKPLSLSDIAWHSKISAVKDLHINYKKQKTVYCFSQMCFSFYLSYNNLQLKPNRELKNSQNVTEIGVRYKVEVQGSIEAK